jgi:hypothetical protein
MLDTHTYAGPSLIMLDCDGNDLELQDIIMTAHAVGTIH